MSIGLVCDLLFSQASTHPELSSVVLKSTGRLESWIGIGTLGTEEGRAWATVSQEVLGELPPLDDAIKPLVVLLNELGFWTEFSCSGHEEKNGGNRGYISVYIERAETLLRLKRLLADIWDEEDGPCDCEGECDFIDGHPPLRSLRNGTPIPEPNMGVRINLIVDGTLHGEWGVRIDFVGYERPLTALDYAWLVEQIELRTGRAKPLQQPLHPQPLQGRKRLLTIQRLL